MAAVNIKMPDALKEQGDSVLRKHDLTATQYITLCYRYLEQYNRPPFNMEVRVFTSADLAISLAGQFGDARNQLHRIKGLLQSTSASSQEVTQEKLSLSRMVTEIQQNGLRLETAPDEGGSVEAARRMLPRLNFHLTECDFALAGVADRLPVTTEKLSAFEMALIQFDEQFVLMQSILRDGGLLPRPQPVREFVYRGDNVTVAIVQPEDYTHGAWLVRLEAKTIGHENVLEQVVLEFPQTEGRVFLPGSVYGAAVRNSRTLKYEQGFRFVSGFSEFHMYSNGRPENENNNSLDQLAAQISGKVDDYIQSL